MESGIFQTARSHKEPFARQFSVFLPNRVGQFLELLDLFAAKEISVVGVSVVDSTDWAIVRMIFNNPNHAREILKTSGHSYTESEVILVELQSENSLRDVCGHLLQAEINVHFVYPLTIRSHDYPVMAFHVDDSILATHILIRQDLTLLGSEDLADPI